MVPGSDAAGDMVGVRDGQLIEHWAFAESLRAR
jgi:hypothetical protein